MAYRTSTPPSAEPWGDDPKLAQLLRSEFGTGSEIAARLAIIVCAAVALHFYIGWSIGLLWGAAYLSSQGFAYWILSRASPPYTRHEIWLGYIAYIVTTTTFVALPAGLLTLDNPALTFCGAMGIIALGVFNLWREEPPAALLPFDIALGFAMGGLALLEFVPEVESGAEQVIMTLLCATAVGYYTMALITTRRARFALKEAARRGVEAQKMEAIGRLSGGVAHDFNNILTVLQGNLELYDEVPEAAERRKLVSEAHVAARRAAALVAQLLAFARRAPLAPETIEVKAVIEDLVSMTSRLLPASVTVYPATVTEPAFVLADRDQLLSSLLNLVINARDAIPERGEITIAARPVAVTQTRPIAALPPGAYLCFSVSDTGTGMAPETAARAIEPFFTTKSVGAGSGLGLSTANGFAEQSGGTLDIKTGPEGTTVSIYLPQALAGTA